MTQPQPPVFRGKRKADPNEWLYGDLSHVNGGLYIFDREKSNTNSTDWYEIDPTTLGWSSGLKDKNGKEESESRKLNELTEVAKVIFSKKPTVSPADLVKLVMEELDVKERMARNYIKFMKDHDIIEKSNTGNGDYSLPFLPF